VQAIKDIPVFLRKNMYFPDKEKIFLYKTVNEWFAALRN